MGCPTAERGMEEERKGGGEGGGGGFGIVLPDHQKVEFLGAASTSACTKIQKLKGLVVGCGVRARLLSARAAALQVRRHRPMRLLRKRPKALVVTVPAFHQP